MSRPDAPTRPAEDPRWLREHRQELRLLLDQRALDTETAEYLRREIHRRWARDRTR